MKQLDPRIKIRAALRCDGIGRLDCAEHADSGQRLAVRWLPLDANGDAAVKACEKLPDHPTLPRILQTGQVGTSAFLALEFPQGQTLAARLGESIPMETILKMGADLASALSTVHAQNVVHGEMNADSVLMIASGRCYLWDMPLVVANRLTDRRGESRLMQNLVKTAAFLAPERARGEGASQAADVYALASLVCAAAGSPLPTTATTLGLVHQIASGHWIPRVPTELPIEWRGMLESMLQIDPNTRPSAQTVAKHFAETAATASTKTIPEMPAVRLPPAMAPISVNDLIESNSQLLPAAMVTAPIPETATHSSQAPEVVVNSPPVEMTNPTVPIVSIEPALLLAPSTPEAQLAKPDVGHAHSVSNGPALSQSNGPQPTVPNGRHATTDEIVEVRGVFRIPTQEIQSMENAPPLPAKGAVLSESGAAMAKHDSVHLTDTISVSAELASGASRVDDSMHIGRSFPLKPLALVGLGIAACFFIYRLASGGEKTVVPLVTPALVVAPIAAPVVPVIKPVTDDDELNAIPNSPKQLKTPTPNVGSQPAPTTQPAPVGTAVEVKVQTKTSAKPAQEFEFLEGAAAPSEELKRPEEL